jgi:vanillate/3-O-methylgallate O-demethylase
MVTLVWDSEDVIEVFASLFRSGEPFEPMEMPRDLLGRMCVDDVLRDGVSIGASTSRCYSHFFRQMLSLCTIDVRASEPGTKVTVVWGAPGGPQKRVRATVAPAPYKRDNRRVDVAKLPALCAR